MKASPNRTVRTYPASNLSQATKPVELFDDSLKELVRYMTEEMYFNNGVGLAANQLGVDKSVIVVDPSGGENYDKFMVMVNPVLKMDGRKIPSKEGCLSVPGVEVEVKRFETCHVSYQGPSGESKEIVLSGLEACIVQHEVDHLHGVTILDRIPIKKRAKLLKEYVRRENQ